MKWLERISFALLGALLMVIVGVAVGSISLAGDFVANVAGATIGGMISVGLAVTMFSYQRKVANEDAVAAATSERAAAIRDALRHVRAIREAVEAGRGITINNGQQLSAAIASSAALANRALETDVNLTDFRLRLAMEEAVFIARQISQTLPAQLSQAGLDDANTPLPVAAATCDPAIKRIDELISAYTSVRNLPSI